MTPAVFCVRPETAAGKVVEKMLALRARRLFVVDQGGALVGVVSAFDVLRGLRPERPCGGQDGGQGRTAGDGPRAGGPPARADGGATAPPNPAALFEM